MAKETGKKLAVIDDEQLTSIECAKALKAIGEHIRIRILKLLLQGERSVLEIADQLNLEQPLVSHHLTVLRHAKLVEDHRAGKRIIYSIHPSVKELEQSILNLGCCTIDFKSSDK